MPAMNVDEAQHAVLRLYARHAPTAGGVIEQQEFLDHVRTLGVSWVDLARGVDALLHTGNLRAAAGPPYGWELTTSGAKLVAALAGTSST